MDRNQKFITEEHLKGDTIPIPENSRPYIEGLTYFYGKDGKLFKNGGKPLSERELKNGVPTPYFPKSQVQEALEILSDLPEGDIIYLLIVNSESQFCQNHPDQVRILGCRKEEDGPFIFASEMGLDPEKYHFSKPENTKKLLEDIGGCVIDTVEGNPLTLIYQGCYYDDLTMRWEYIRGKFFPTGGKLSLTQFLVYCFAIKEQDTYLSMCSKVKQEKGKEIVKRLHEIYHLLDPEVLLGEKKVFLKVKSEGDTKMIEKAHSKDIEKAWREVIGVCKSMVSSKQIEPEYVFRHVCGGMTKMALNIAKIIDYWPVMEIQ